MAENDKDTDDTAALPPRPISQLDVGGVPVRSVAEDPEFGVAYPRAGQVRQNLAELRNALAHGNRERAKAARKTLRSLGFDVEAWEKQQQDKPVDGNVDARSQPPEGRSATPPGQVRTSEPVPAQRQPASGSAAPTAAPTASPPSPSATPKSPEKQTSAPKSPEKQTDTGSGSGSSPSKR